MSLDPPPIYNPITDNNGNAPLPWVLFFNQIFNGDQGSSWIPNFVNLTVVGVPQVSGKYYRVGALTYFEIVLIPGTSTSSTAGTTYIDNFPLQFQSDGFNIAVGGVLTVGAGMNQAVTNRIYPPSWSAVTVPLTITGFGVAK